MIEGLVADMQIDVRTNIKEVQRKLGRMSRELKDKAAVMAINKTAAKAKTELVRAITAEYVIKAAEIRPRLRLQRARRGRLTAVIDPWKGSRRRSLNLIHFLENKVSLAEMKRRRKKGAHKQLRFKIKKGSPPKIIRGAFIQNRGRTIFIRTDTTMMPIEPVQTVGVPQMFGVRRINARVIRRIRKEFPIEYMRAARHATRKFR